MSMSDERELDLLLSEIAIRVDMGICHGVDERYRRALTYEEVDRPPLVVQPEFGHSFDLPEPWNKFRRYSYREGFDDPAAMMQNMLLARVVPGLVLGDDSPLAIRNDHGTIQIGSAVGGNWMLHENNFPWIEHFDSLEPIERIAKSTEPVDLNAGVLPRSFATLKYYVDKLNEFPQCAEAVQISMPDLQGPLDTADLLWGSGIYYAFADAPELLNKLLSRLVDVILQVYQAYKPYTHDRLDPTANTQHGYLIPGRLLIRNDSAIMLSPETYAEFVRHHDVRLLREVGSGAIHFCGNGQHLVEKMIEPDEVKGLDFGEIHLMDGGWIYGVCRERKVSLHRVTPPREDLVSGKARRDFPTGVVFVYQTDSIDDALDVVRSYSSN
ncbi:MAG: hypothetical protein M1133_11755 [Armatimonadetes bacterium]|nr:hypothetical protein [Armatimonadota bacterium]